MTFLAPFIACAVCARVLHEPFTRINQIGGVLSLVGVVLIARPTSLFTSSDSPTTERTAPSPDESSNNFATVPEATDAQRLAAVGVSM